MCFKCHHLLIPADRCILFVYQMDALKLGLVSCVDEMQYIYLEEMGCSDVTACKNQTLKECFDDPSYQTFRSRLETCLLTASAGKLQFYRQMFVGMFLLT